MQSNIFPQVLDLLRTTLIDNMVRPKEVLVVLDDDGVSVEEIVQDVQNIQLYEEIRETLIFLTHIDQQAMDSCIQARLDKITNDKEYFSFERLNKLCWALGTISGCMSLEDENKFVVSVVKELLNLCEKTQGKGNKAHIASDIMYVVGQFPNFLIGQWQFLRTVIKKLNEFMHESHPGVQDMASETFLKIAKLTKHMFTQPQMGQRPYIIDLINDIPQNYKDLQNHQILMAYEGLGHMISTAQQNQGQLVLDLLNLVNNDWQAIIQKAF